MWIVLGYAGLALGSLGAYLYLKRQKKQWKYRSYLPVLAVIGGICLIAGLMEQAGGVGRDALTRLERGKAGDGEVQVPLLLETEGLSGSCEYLVTVEERKLTETESEQAFKEAGRELEQVILGENQSPDRITANLAVPDQLLEGLVAVECFFEPYDLVDMDGTILWENLTADTGMVKVTANISCS